MSYGAVFSKRFEFFFASIVNIQDIICWVCAGLVFSSSASKQKVILVLEEALANVVRHGYLGQGGMVLITTISRGHDVKIIISDCGVSVNPLLMETILPTKESPVVKGLGMHFIKSLCQETFYARNGNTNVLTLIVHS